MIFKGTQYGYDGYSNFVDRSTTMALRREKFELWKRERERKAWQKKKLQIEEENKRKIEAGEPEDALEPIPSEPEVPFDPRTTYTWDRNQGIKMHASTRESQTKEQICGEMFDSVFSGYAGSAKFESEVGELFPSLEVMKLSLGKEAEEMRALQKERMKEREAKNALYGEAFPGKFDKKFALYEKIKSMTVDEWVMCVISLFRTVPLLVTSIDLDVKRIAFNSGRYNAKKCSTVTQIETMLRLNEQKEMLLNIYVLNKLFAGLCLTYEERMVFLCVMQKSLPAEKILSQKLRTAYRTRRRLLRRFREFVLRRGYNAEWFYEHFGFLPCVHYYVDKNKEGEDKRLRELEMAKHEHTNDGVDVLSFLNDDNNVEGDPAVHEDISLKHERMKNFRRERNERVVKAGLDLDKVKKNEAKMFAYRLSAAHEFDKLMDNLSEKKRAKVEPRLSARSSKNVLKEYMKEVADYEAGESV